MTWKLLGIGKDGNFRREIIAALQPELNSSHGMSTSDGMALINRWAETPEGKAKIEQNKEEYENLKQHWDLAAQCDMKREHSYSHQIIGTMDDKGRFQLDDLTPGNWTLEVTLNFPSVPLQWWDFADVWKKEIEIMVPELPSDRKEEVLQLQGIPLGFDKSDRKGPER